MVLRPLIVTSLCFLAVLRLSAAGPTPEKLNALLNNSPFGAGRTNAAGGAGTGDPLEFRAILEEGGKRFFSIYDAATKRSTWVELDDPVNGFSVKGFDAAHDTVAVEFHGKSLSLPIKRAAPVPQPAMAPQGGGPAGQAPQAGAAAVDQQRLQQVQEEIRRRRALRMSPPSPTNTPGAPAGPQPMPVTPADSQAGPQLIPPNPANPQSGPQPVPNKS